MAAKDSGSGVRNSGNDALELDVNGTIKTLVEFIRTHVERSGTDGVVVGLSGGIDSAVAAYLAVRALGPERVRYLMLPWRDSHSSSLDDARRVADAIGIEGETLDISPMVDAFRAVAGETDRIRLGNVMARARMILLFDRSAKHRSLVLGTSNKSEILLGYGTLHGDLACAINPLGDLYKTQIRALALELGVPETIRNKRPSADLWPDQADEDELGVRYDEVDRLFVVLVEGRATRREAIERGFDPELVDRATRFIARYQFKRRLPAIPRISNDRSTWGLPYPSDWVV